MADLLGNPRLARAQKLELFFGVGGDRLSAPVRNLVTILVEGARASLLPEIAAQFARSSATTRACSRCAS